MERRESEGEWDREGRKGNEMERRSRQGRERGSRGGSERDLHMMKENGQK